MKFLGIKDGLPQFAWCCDKARDTKDAIGFLDDGKRRYDSDRTGFYIHGAHDQVGNRKIYKINFCPWCSAKVED